MGDNLFTEIYTTATFKGNVHESSVSENISRFGKLSALLLKFTNSNHPEKKKRNLCTQLKRKMMPSEKI